jgi:hypothetical protein
MLEKYTDVSNLEEYKQYSAWEEYSEVFKSKNGFRPRWTSWKENSAESWDKMINNLYSVKKNGELP